MIALESTCPNENRLVMALQGLLPNADRADLEQHLDTCTDCRAQMAQLLKATVKRESGDDLHDKEASQLLPRGTNLGRYVLLDCIGRGGMALVYSAYDPELDRKVAVKVLRTDLGASDAPSGLRGLLLREAQAMARLSHPNVIAVYDVGTLGDQVFLAMEFVKGTNLRQWLKDAPRSWREILQLYLRAGEGLAAAHQAGLVHGDFKPDNVLVGPEDQVRVTDFGLSRQMRPSETGLGKEIDAPAFRLAGTPLYLSPEQWKGASANERTDQFSYCVTLYEALYGMHPSAGEQRSADVTGKPPHWVRRIILRGLSADPADRYLSMQQLLLALHRGLRAMRYRRWIAASAVALLALGVAADQSTQISARRKAGSDLHRAVALLQTKWSEELKVFDLKVEGDLRKKFLGEALGKADDIDTVLGLSRETPEHGLAWAHEVIKSADLLMLKKEDVLLFVDGDGHVIYNLAHESTYGQKLVGLDLVEKALSGESVEAIWSPAQVPALLASSSSTKGLLLILARPISRGERRLGAVLVGRWMGTSLIKQLEQTVGDRVVLSALDGTQVTTLQIPPSGLVPFRSEEAPALLRIGASRYLVQSGGLTDASGETIGLAFLLKDQEEELAPLVSRLRKGELRLGVGVLAFALAAYAFWAVSYRRAALRLKSS